MFNTIKIRLQNYSKVFENYFFMTLMQLVNALFSILIYPYLIRTLGIEQYGHYVFSLALTGYFTALVSFGFSWPSITVIAQNQENKVLQSHTVSAVFTAKVWLAFFSALIFAILLFSIEALQTYWYLNVVCFFQIFADLLFPVWLFQGLQKMKNVTAIQLTCRLLSLPFIFILIKQPADLIVYAWIATLTVLVSGGIAFVQVIKIERIPIQWIPIRELKPFFKDALPFFYTSIAGNIKEQTIRILIGSCLNVRDLAIYDLANKVISIPRYITNSINGAIFPQIIRDYKPLVIRKIIRYEYILGFAIMLIVILFGKPVILLLGGSAMAEAYPVSVILSFTIVSWLIVGSYLDFLFIPQHKYYFVTVNQLVALLSFVMIALGVLFFCPSVTNMAIAMAFSGLVEICFCKIVTKRNHLMV
jgi:polysaccharide transporter, PST family